MARFDKGWVKLWRRSALSDLGSNYNRLGIFGTLMMWAIIQPSRITWKGKPKNLAPGDVVTSVTELAEYGEVDKKTVRKHLAYLELRGTITIQRSQKGLIISLNNWSQYQGDTRGVPDGVDLSMDGGVDGCMDGGVPLIREYNNKRSKEGEKATPAGSTTKYHFSKTEKGQRLDQVIKDIFGKNPPAGVTRQKYEIAKAFEFELDRILVWSEGLSSQKGWQDKSPAERIRYKAKALLDECGLSESRGVG